MLTIAAAAAPAFAELLRAVESEGFTAESLGFATPEAIAANTGRIYEWMGEHGLSPDSWTREALFEFASASLGLPYDAFYDAWLDEVPVQ